MAAISGSLGIICSEIEANRKLKRDRLGVHGSQKADHEIYESHEKSFSNHVYFLSEGMSSKTQR